MVAVQLYLLGGTRQIDEDHAGIEPFVLLASAYGTKKYPGESARRALARAGSSINVSAESDWTVYRFDALKEEFDSTWGVFADRLMQPTLDSATIELVRQRMLGEVARRHASPEDYAQFLADSLAFHGHVYAIPANGSERSLRALNADALRRYAGEQFVTSRMVLVVVGDVRRERVERAAARTFGMLPRGSYQWSLPAEPPVPEPDIVAAHRPTTTNYIVGTVLGPPRSSKEYPAFERAMYFLDAWISAVVRVEQGLSYAAGVEVNDRAVPSASIFLSTTRPDTTLKLVNAILTRVASNITIPRAVLRSAAQSFTTTYIRRTESASTHAALLARALLYEGDPSAASRRADVMGRLAFPDLRRSIREYVKNIQYAFVGDTTHVPRREMIRR
jgi:zinc protease